MGLAEDRDISAPQKVLRDVWGERETILGESDV